MKYQVLFSLKTMKTYSRLLSAAVVFGALRVNSEYTFYTCYKTSSFQYICLKF